MDAHLTAIGAFERVTLGFFELRNRNYKKIRLDEQNEVLQKSRVSVFTNGRVLDEVLCLRDEPYTWAYADRSMQETH